MPSNSIVIKKQCDPYVGRPKRVAADFLAGPIEPVVGPEDLADPPSIRSKPRIRAIPPVLKKGERGTRQLTEARLHCIASLMREVKWIRGVSAMSLAKQWGISEQRVHELAAEASKRVRAEVEDPDSVRRDVNAALQKILEDSIQDGDRRHALSAAKILTWVMGTAAPTRVQVTDVPLERLPADERKALVEEAIAVLEEPKSRGKK